MIDNSLVITDSSLRPHCLGQTEEFFPSLLLVVSGFLSPKSTHLKFRMNPSSTEKRYGTSSFYLASLNFRASTSATFVYSDICLGVAHVCRTPNTSQQLAMNMLGTCRKRTSTHMHNQLVLYLHGPTPSKPKFGV